MRNPAYSIREIANWILDFADQRNAKITNMALNKLAYFAYEHALVKYNVKITNAKIEAWEHGPVFREIYKSFKEFDAEPIKGRAKKYNAITDSIEISLPKIFPEDEIIIEEAIVDIIKLPAPILREISHADNGAWASVWYHEDATNPGMHISDEIIIRQQRYRARIQ